MSDDSWEGNCSQVIARISLGTQTFQKFSKSTQTSIRDHLFINNSKFTYFSCDFQHY